MPLPALTRDYVTVGGKQTAPFLGETVFTWGQVRTPVYAAVHTTGDYTFFNAQHAYDYYNFGPTAFCRAADEGGRLFRGTPFGAPGYNDHATVAPGNPPVIQQRFYFGHVVEDPLNPGIFIPRVHTGLDKDYESDILLGATYTGTGATVVVTAPAFDGSDPDGQNIGGTATGDITTVTLSF